MSEAAPRPGGSGASAGRPTGADAAEGERYQKISGNKAKDRLLNLEYLQDSDPRPKVGEGQFRLIVAEWCIS